MRVAKAGGSAEKWVEGQEGMDQIVVDSDSVFFRSNSGLWRVSKSGGQAGVLAARQAGHNVDRLVGDGSHLYFFHRHELFRQIRHRTASASAAGPPRRLRRSPIRRHGWLCPIVTCTTSEPPSLNDDALAKWPKAGGTPELVDGSGYSTGYLTVSGLAMSTSPM
jgi:hypothetical protein